MIWVAIGSVVGSLVRYTLGVLLPSNKPGNLAANIIGVALASFFLVLMERRGITKYRLLLLPGFCAGLTTFSGVTYQALKPIDFGYLFETLIFSFITIAIVLPLSRKYVKVRS
jgi:CrcB protein